VGVVDNVYPAVAGTGGFATLLYVARVLLSSDKPLRHAVVDIQKRLDVEREHSRELEVKSSDLLTQRDEARTEATLAKAELKWVKQQLTRAETENTKLRSENTLLRGDDR
jgi:uncharacterized protein (DUF3084 family)